MWNTDFLPNNVRVEHVLTMKNISDWLLTFDPPTLCAGIKGNGSDCVLHRFLVDAGVGLENDDVYFTVTTDGGVLIGVPNREKPKEFVRPQLWLEELVIALDNGDTGREITAQEALDIMYETLNL